MNAYCRVRCSIPSHLEEELPELLSELQLLGIEIGPQGAARVRLTVYLREVERSAAAGIESVLAPLGGRDFEWSSVDDEDWMAPYRLSVSPFAVGDSWWIDPHPETPTPAPDGRHRLVVPPRTAFGSGSHESTQLILCALERMRLDGANVVDVGTGSGILSFAAERLGAGGVLAVDVDPVAVRTAGQISALQEWRPSVHFVTGSADCAAPGHFEVALANMITANFVPLLSDMRKALSGDGVLVLSGLLATEGDEVENIVRGHGFSIESVRTMGEWAGVMARPVS